MSDEMNELQEFLNALAALEKPDGVIAFPTDTVYGMGCLPTHVLALEKIYQLKGRDLAKPLILMAHTQAALTPFIGELSLAQAHTFQQLAKSYWPGALTIVLPKSETLPQQVVQGHNTVGLRIPNCPFLWNLFDILPKKVLATTSANFSGEVECQSAAEVLNVFGPQLDFLLIKDNLGSHHASTVCSIDSQGEIHILRQGTLVLN